MSGVSIIIPYHRGVHFLKDCLESVTCASLTDYEVILVIDDKSEYVKGEVTPSEEMIEDVLKLYEEVMPIHCYRLRGAAGVAAARNYGIKKAHKEYVYFLDSDDYLYLDGLNGMLELASVQGASVVYGSICRTWFKRYTFMKQQNNQESNQQGIQGDESACDRWQERVSHHSNVAFDTKDAASLLFKEEVSALNILVKRDWLIDHELFFNEKNPYYSDIAFVTGLLAMTSSEEHLWYYGSPCYVKRYHNDSIVFPSLSQMKDKARCEYFLDALVEAIRYCMKDTDEVAAKGIEQVLEQYCLEYLVTIYEAKYHSGNDKVMESHIFEAYSKLLQDMQHNRIVMFERPEQKILYAIRANQREKAVKIANRIILKRKKKGLLGNTIQRARALDKVIFRRLSMKENWVVFESFGGKSYSDNCKYIYEYMLNKYGDTYKYVWVMRDSKGVIPGNPIVVQPNTYRYVYYLSRAKYVVFNSRQPDWYEKRRNTVFIQTWHGTPLKKLVFDMEDVHSASRTHKEDFYRVSRKWDYLLSDNTFSTEVFEHAFLFDKDKIAQTGYPRNDLLYASNQTEIANKVKKRLGIPLDKKVILYAPTWRDDEYYASGQYKFSLAIDIKALKENFGEEYVLLLRTHYFVVDQVDSFCKDSFVYNGSRYQDITELYLASDICVTDYSSVFFDFANLRRPILFFTYDLEKYREELHGFYIDMESEVPGPLLQTNEELIEAIKNIDEVENTYKEKYQKFYDRFCSIDDGHASERVVEELIRKNVSRNDGALATR